MLTYPSDPLPQIVCPMDEDAIPPTRFCSASPHSEPPPPLLSLSSITPSCENDGLSAHRRSGRIQCIRAQTPKKQSITDNGAAQKPPRQNSSPPKRQRESGTMVQESQSKQPRVESTHEHEKQKEGGLDFSLAAEQNNPQKKTNVTTAENAFEQFVDNTTQNLDTKSDMDTCGGLAVGHNVDNAFAPKGWVIGPLFQSFKSKMASFTEIVMSPVKLFRANSPPLSMDHPEKLDGWELQADGTSDVENFEPIDTFHPEAQSENGNQDAKVDQQTTSEVQGAQNAKTTALKYSKKLSFDVDLPTHSSEQEGELAITQKEKNSPDSVPLKHSHVPCIVSEDISESIESVIRSSVLLQSSVSVSASHQSKLKASSSMEDQKGKLATRLKAPPRKYTGNRKKVTVKTLASEDKKEAFQPENIEEQVSHMKAVKSNKTDLNNEKTLSLSTSVSFAKPDIDGEDDGRKIESCDLVRQSLQNNLSDSANGRTLEPALDTQQLECHLKPEAYSAAVLGRAKRELKVDSHSQDFVKRKRLTADICTKDTKGELLNVASDGGVLRGLGPARKEVVSTNTSVDEEETLKPARKRQAISTRAHRKGKGGQEMLAMTNEAVLNSQAKSSSDAALGCSPDETSGVSENNQICSGRKVKPSGPCKRLKTRTGLGKLHVSIDNCMDLETTRNNPKQPEPESASEVLIRPDTKQLQSTSKCRNINKKPLKRKSPNQASSNTETDSTLVSTSSALSMEPLELKPTDFNTSQHGRKEESRRMELNQPSKRTKKGFRSAVKSSTSGGIQESKRCIHNLNLVTKEKQPKEDKGKVSTDPVYFEMTPFESNQQPVLSPSQVYVDCYVLLNNMLAMDGKGKSTFSVEDEVFPTDSEASNHSSINVSRPRSSTRRVNIKPRRTDNQRRKCRVLHSRTHKGEEMTNSTVDDADLATRSSQNSRRLLRSYSCPEIPSLHPHDTTWTSVQPPDLSRIHTPHQHQPSHTPFDHHAHKSLRRARRHTVCSLEVEREIAPLCLRKEVYPSRKSVPYDGITQNMSPSLTLSPSTSLTALASCFLSSPLAFLSKKFDSRGAAASTSSHVSSPTSSSSMYSLSPCMRRLPGVLQRTDSSSATLDSSSSGISLECEIARRQQSEEDDDGEDTSSSSQEFEDVGLREEKALSDSEIKVVQKIEERGKVSSIRIRKTLPKPQNNLTPMGLPKPIRLKKKEFSLEEIYTNKNFSKPPESRLETIFEVPLSRRNGSESWFGQRRVKRFLEFLEVGEARKPKKPLVGVGKAGVPSSRTRRGGFPKDEPSLSVQDVDSLLCAKLEQLNLWLVHDQKDS